MSEASVPVTDLSPTRSVRYRILAIALLPTLVILPLLLGVTMARWNTKFDALLISKVNGDLTIAHQYLARILENTGEHVVALGNSTQFRDNTIADTRQLTHFLETSRHQLGLDFLFILDANGQITAAAPGADPVAAALFDALVVMTAQLPVDDGAS